MTLRKRILVTVLLAFIAIPMIGGQNVSYAAEREISVFVDGEKVNFIDVKPFIQNSRTLVPVKFISEELGAAVNWDKDTKTVTITKGSDIITLVIGNTIAKRNKIARSMDVPPVIKDGRTMVPLKFVSDMLDAGVEWNQDKYAVYITTTEEPANVAIIPPTADELDKLIQEMAQVNSSIGNLNNADADHTRNFISGLDKIYQNLGTNNEVNTVYGGNGAAVIVGLNRATSDHYLTIRQANRKNISFDATWAALDLLFSTKDATTVWDDMIGYLEEFNTNPNLLPKTGSIDGFKYTIDIFLPNGYYIYFDKK